MVGRGLEVEGVGSARGQRKMELVYFRFDELSLKKTSITSSCGIIVSKQIKNQHFDGRKEHQGSRARTRTQNGMLNIARHSCSQTALLVSLRDRTTGRDWRT